MPLAIARAHYPALLIAAMLACSLLLLAAQQREAPSGGPDLTYVSMDSKAHGKPHWTGLNGDGMR
jgi:hypothetical protein